MVDLERLRTLLDRLRDTESQLQRLEALGFDAVRHDPDRLNSTKYLFVVAAETAIDIGQHIIASEGLAVPATFAGVFEELARGPWLPDDLATSMVAVARFRNLLVHGYADVDDDRVVEILHANIVDLASFRREIARSAQTEG